MEDQEDAVSKVEFPLDKRYWQPSPLPGQVVLVTTLAADGEPNVAPKSWVSMVAFGPPPVLMFGCTLDHATARNAIERGAFVINVPGQDLVEQAWQCGSNATIRGAARFAAFGLTPVPSGRVAPPRIRECRAHLGCETDGFREWGREVVVFGRIVAASADTGAFEGDQTARYRYLSPFFFLEDGWAACLGVARSVEVADIG